jgi:hypothetical protein
MVFLEFQMDVGHSKKINSKKGAHVMFKDLLDGLFDLEFS